MNLYKTLFVVATWILLVIFALVVFASCTKTASKTCWECSTIPTGSAPGRQIKICQDGTEPPTAADYGGGSAGSVYNCKKK